MSNPNIQNMSDEQFAALFAAETKTHTENYLASIGLEVKSENKVKVDGSKTETNAIK